MNSRPRKSSERRGKPRHLGPTAPSIRSGGSCVSGFIGSTLTALILLATLAAPAFAVQTHPFTGVSIGPEGKSVPGAFHYLTAVEVDHSNGDLYVLATGPKETGGLLYRFDSAGEPLDFKASGTNFISAVDESRYSSEIAIAPPGSPGGSAGDIYVAGGNKVAIFSPEGEQIGSILGGEQACGVATDAAGNLYVKSGSYENPVVHELTPTANPDAPIEVGHSIAIPYTCRIAVDGAGRIYTAGPIGGVGPSGALRLQSLDSGTTEQTEPLAETVAVEPGTDDLYAGPEDEVRQYASGGSLISTFGEGIFDQVEGVAVAGAGGDVYVADDHGPANEETSRIDVFGPISPLPDAVAESPNPVTKTSAVLRGTISAGGGPEATCNFEYLPATALPRQNEEQQLSVAASGGTFTLSFAGPGGGPVQTTEPLAYDASPYAVEAALQALSNLGAGNVNVFRKTETVPYSIAFQQALGGKNVEQITVDPSDLTGTGGGPEAEVRTLVNGQLGGWGGAKDASCAPAGPFTGEASEAVSAEISGLAPAEKYAFRLVAHNAYGSLASNENGSAPAEVSNFETLPAFAVRSGVTANLTTTSVTLTGTINPEGVDVNECYFEYGRTESYGSVAQCLEPDGGEVGDGSAPVAVDAKVEELVPNTGYDFRLVSGSAELGGISVRGANVPFETHGPPRIISQTLSGIGQDGVTVLGSINPGGEPTTYQVEYVTEAEFAESGYAAASRFPLEAVGIGSGQTAVEVGQSLAELPPGTKYHVRLSASNALGSVPGPDQTFRTQVGTQVFGTCAANEAFRVEWSALLPDCRAYEQASSPDKNGGGVGGLYTQVFAAEDGSAVTFYTPAFTLPPAERGGTQNYATYLASRDEAIGSWSSQRLLPPQQFGSFAEFLGSTNELRYAVVEAGILHQETGLFEIDTETGQVTQIVQPIKSAGDPTNQFGLDGATPDGSRIFFESTAKIRTTPEVPAPVEGHDNLYMWEQATGDVSLVGVLPIAEGGEAPAGGSFGGAYDWYGEGNEDTTGGGALNRGSNEPEPLAVAAVHAISTGGDQVFFTAAGTGQLYLRSGLGGLDPTTVRISTPNRGITSPQKPAAFQEATPDGSRAFFLSRQKLTVNATTGEAEQGRDLYRWDASAPSGKALTDIAPDPEGPEDPNGAEVQGLLGIAPDGSSGYFLARGVLATGATQGEENLYRFQEEAGGHVHVSFIANIAKGGGIQSPDRRNVSPKVSTYEIGKTSRLSEDGETLLFTSSSPVPTAAFPQGYDNFNLEGISCEGGRCPELYRYSAGSEEVTCVSCDPTGEAPLGAADLQDQFFNAYFTPNEPPAVMPSRNLSADGSRVFFQTPDPLVARDENGKESCPASGGQPGQHDLQGPGRCQDVYEWEAVGSGTCRQEEANGGCLYLLSTGESDQASYFVGASKDGSNAFIATTSQLVPADRDQADDVYDVRVDGGLSSQYVTAQPPCGSAEACKGSPSTPPPAAAPGTPTFHGAGNDKVAQCKRGYIRKAGKCVKKSSGKNNHHRKKHIHKKQKRTPGKKSPGGAQ